MNEMQGGFDAKMKQNGTVSVICEYNPFHFGHEYQLQTLKNRFDKVVCIMSGNIVQRGSVAIADKYIRAEAALRSGADLVLELPVPYCCSSARDFASAGVYIADAIGSDFLAFSAEDESELLFKIHELSKDEAFNSKVQETVRLNKSLSFPQAVTSVIEKHLGSIAAEAVKKPNNILSLEYLKALEGTDVTPFTVKRNPDFESSSMIRARKDGNLMLSLLPAESASVFARELGRSFPRDEKKLDAYFVATLRRIGGSSLPTDELYSVPKDLAKKILQAAIKHSETEKIISSVADKCYTHARVRRAINALVFGITAKRVSEKPPYTTVLAANEKGREVLRKAKSLKRIDIVNKPVRALELGEETKNAFLFAKGIEDVISLSDPIPSPADAGRNPFIGEQL